MSAFESQQTFSDEAAPRRQPVATLAWPAKSPVEFSEWRLRKIFGDSEGRRKWGRGDGAAAAEAPEGADPLFPSLDAEAPPAAAPDPTGLRRPSWDPRDRWRKLRASQPLLAPPDSDLPPELRYEDLAAFETGETVEADSDPLLAWLVERFERNLEFKGGPPQREELSADEAIRLQVRTELQTVEGQLDSLGLAGANPGMLAQRRQLLLMQQEAETAAKSPAPASADTWEQEAVNDAASSEPLVSPQLLLIQTVVVTTQEAKAKPHHHRRCAGDPGGPGEFLVDVQPRRDPRLAVAEFGDAAPQSGESGRKQAGWNAV